MCEISYLNQKISSPSENPEKAVNDMKVQDKNVDLLHENIKILQINYPTKRKSSNLLWKFNRQCWNDQISYQQQHHQQQQQQQQQWQQSQQLLEHNKQTMYEQHQQQIQQNQHTQNI